MSFGWSAGDVWNALQLVKNVYDAFHHIPDAKKSFKESMQFLVAFEANLHLIYTYKTKSSSNRSGPSAEAIEGILQVVQVEFEKFKSFLQSKQALHEHVQTETMRKKIQSMLQAVHWGIRDLNKKVHELRQALTQVLSVLGLYLTYEFNNHVSAVSENVQNVERLIRGNQDDLTDSLGRVDDNFARAIKSLQGAQVGWELLLRDTMQGWTAAMKDQSNTHSTRLDEQTETIDSLKAQVEVQTEALQRMRSEMQETMNQVGSAMQIVLKKINDDIQIDNAKDSTIVQKSKKVHKQHRSLEKLLLASTQAGNIVKKGTEQAMHTVSPIQMAILFKQLDTRLKQIGLSSVMARFVNDGRKLGKGMGRGSLQAIRALQQAWASIGLTVQSVLHKKQLPMARTEVHGLQAGGSPSGPREGDPDPPEPTRPTVISPALTPTTNDRRPKIPTTQPNLFISPTNESPESSQRKNSYDRSKKAPPPPPPLSRNQSPVIGTETLSDWPAGPSSTHSAPTPPIPISHPPAIRLPSALSSPSLATPRSLSPKAPPPPVPTTPPPERPALLTTQRSTSSLSPISRTPPPIPNKKPLELSVPVITKQYSVVSG